MNLIISGLFLVIMVCWILTLIQSHRLFYSFREKYPEVAESKISNAFGAYADPEKILFFFRKENKSLLKQDKVIWQMRNQVKLLLIISVGIPLSIFLIAMLSFISH